MSKSVKAAAAAALILLLGACGGGGGDSGEIGAGASTAKLKPTWYSSEGRLVNTCTLSAACSGNPYAPFAAGNPQAPADGATVSGVVHLEVNGNEMVNVELLPASGYTPRYGVFRVTGDGVVAWMDLDTTKLPNGPVTVRISAFDVAAGQAGAREIVAMPPRTWNINNPGGTPAAFAATLTAAPANGAAVSGITHLEIQGSGIANAELLPASGYAPRLGVFNVSADRTRAWLDFDSRSLPDGAQNVRISAYNVTEGQPGAQEIVAMPGRQWNVSNGSSAASPFTARVTMAPPHGAVLAGDRVRLEVEGSGLKNVELLPASGYTPRYGVFNVNFQGTWAWLELNVADLPAGLLEARISAFDVAAGQAGAREIIAMPARQWQVQH